MTCPICHQSFPDGSLARVIATHPVHLECASLLQNLRSLVHHKKPAAPKPQAKPCHLHTPVSTGLDRNGRHTGFKCSKCHLILAGQ